MEYNQELIRAYAQRLADTYGWDYEIFNRPGTDYWTATPAGMSPEGTTVVPVPTSKAGETITGSEEIAAFLNQD